MTDLLLGANVALLVAASRLADAGRDVALLTDGQKLGGHFRGMTLEGHDYDIGRVMIERADPKILSAVAERPRTDLNWTHWAGVVDELFTENVELRQTVTPQSFVGGRRWPDHIISNRLDVLAGGFPPPPVLPRDDERHASHKAVSSVYDSLSYAEAALLNHGDEVHQRLVEPFVQKVMGVGSEAFLARYHRSAWAPLYWPETVAEACAGGPVSLPEYTLWASSTGCTAELVRQLVAKVRASARVVIDEAPVQELLQTQRGIEVIAGSGRRWSGSRLGLGLSAARAVELTGVPAPEPRQAAAVVVAFGLARGSAITAETTCLYVVDPDQTTYRITDQDSLAGSDPEWHRIVVEGTASRPGGAGAPDSAEVLDREARAHLGIEDPGDFTLLRTLCAEGAKPVPTAAGVASVRALEASLREAVPGVELTGVLFGWEGAALNEQLVQGHRLAEAWTA